MNPDPAVYDLCPTCNAPYTSRCRCFRGDMVCASGHSWYHCPLCGVRIAGRSDHAKPIADSYCAACRTARTGGDS